jgi:DNA-binding Xre family transcriptional regulator
VSQDSERPGGPYTNEISEALYQRRTTVTALAEAIGLKRQDASEIVNGWRLPSAEQLDAICASLSWSPERLYPREEFRLAIEATRRAVVA